MPELGDNHTTASELFVGLADVDVSIEERLQDNNPQSVFSKPYRRVSTGEESKVGLEITQKAFSQADRIGLILNEFYLGHAMIGSVVISGIQEILRQDQREVPLDVYVHPSFEELFAGFVSDSVRVIPSLGKYPSDFAPLYKSGNVFLLDCTINGIGFHLGTRVSQYRHQEASVTTVNHYMKTTFANFQAEGGHVGSRFTKPLEILLSRPEGSISEETVTTYLPLPSDEEEVLREFHIAKDRPGIVWVHTGSVPDKYCEPDKIVSVLRQMKEAHPQYPLYMIVSDNAPFGKREDDIRQELQYAGFGGGEVIFIKGPLAKIAIALGAMALAIASDSGVGHLAAAMGTKVVSLYTGSRIYTPKQWQSNDKQHPLAADASLDTFLDVNEVPEKAILSLVQNLLEKR